MRPNILYPNLMGDNRYAQKNNKVDCFDTTNPDLVGNEMKDNNKT
jgi:hypothetical protein